MVLGSSTDISEDWEKDFDLDMTEEEVQMALSKADASGEVSAPADGGPQGSEPSDPRSEDSLHPALLAPLRPPGTQGTQNLSLLMTVQGLSGRPWLPSHSRPPQIGRDPL